MTDAPGSPLERLDELLAQLEVAPAELRDDPHGLGWLPVEALALVQAHPQCQQALQEFVEGELSLWSARPSSSAPAVDPFFTARVVESLPSPRSGTSLSPRRRAMLLGLFHVIAGVLAYAVLTMVPESTARWAAQAHSVLSWGSELGSSMWLGATAMGAALLAVLAVARAQRPVL